MNSDTDGGILNRILSADMQSAAVKLFFIALFFLLCLIGARCLGAVNGSSVNELKKRAEHGDKKAQKALGMAENDEKITVRCMSGIFFNFAFGTMLSSVSLTSLFSDMIKNSVPEEAFLPLSAGIMFCSVMVSAFLMYTLAVLFGERSGERRGEELLMKNIALYEGITALFLPFAALADLVSYIILGIFGNHTKKDQNQRTEEEILMMVDEGEESGAIEENTKDMIENVFEFDDKCVDEIMTHRKDVIAVKLGSPITEAAQKAIESGKSRLPVFGEDIDDIEGILYVKDLLRYVCTDMPTETVTKDIIKEAVFVPESKKCSEMFEYMTESRIQIAVVVDEFGGTGGIITMEDLLESIVGNIQDEYDNEDEDIKKLDERSFTVSGSTSLDEISNLTGLNFEDEEDDTIAGIMLDRMGHIPKSGEHPSVVINGTRFTVQEVEDRRISKVLVVKPKSDKNTADETH